MMEFASMRMVVLLVMGTLLLLLLPAPTVSICCEDPQYIRLTQYGSSRMKNCKQCYPSLPPTRVPQLPPQLPYCKLSFVSDFKLEPFEKSSVLKGCDGICKSRCGPDESSGITVLGYCGRGCHCCKPALPPPCMYGASCGLGGKCRSGPTCPKGEKPTIGKCGFNRNCICCAPDKPTGSCELMGQVYATGTVFQENCMKFKCEEGNWKSFNLYNAECSECSFRNDPHFTTFDDLRYDWHGNRAYIISQVGCELCPDIFVASLFKDCVSGLAWATCIDTVYFRPEIDTFITIVKDNTLINSQIIIDGYTQDLSGVADGDLMTLKGNGGVDKPAFAWMKSGCIHVMGLHDHGYLVKICGWEVKVFSYPTPSMQNNLCGLCGNSDGNKWNDIRLRDGTIEPPPDQTSGIPWEDQQLEPIYGNYWEVQDCDGNEAIIAAIGNKPRPEYKKKTGATEEEIKIFRRRCEGMNINGQDLFIDACAFDQCIAERSGDEALAQQWLAQTKAVILQGEQQKEDTVKYTKECIAPWVNKTICFLVVQKKMNWESAQSYCQKEGGELAIVDTRIKRTDIYHQLSELKLSTYWLGGNNIESEISGSRSWFWLNSNPVTDGWASGQPKSEGNCMYVYPKRFGEGYDIFYNYRCTYTNPFICQK